MELPAVIVKLPGPVLKGGGEAAPPLQARERKKQGARAEARRTRT